MNKTLEDFIGNTPLVRLQRLPGSQSKNVILAKLEGNNPAGSVKDRPAISMIRHAEERGRIKRGDTLIEPTSGNTGIALAMAAATRGYRMVLIMPEHLSAERRQTMRAFGAEIVLTPQKGGMEAARDLAERMVREGKGTMLDQFANPDNPLVHYETTGPEIWRDTDGRITHFVSSMGTTGTIMGCSRFFKEKNKSIQIIGCQPEEGSQIPGIRKWPEAYLPKIYDPSTGMFTLTASMNVARGRHAAALLPNGDVLVAGGLAGAYLRHESVHARALSLPEFVPELFERVDLDVGIAALTEGIGQQLDLAEERAVLVTIICDRGDRYLTTGVFPD